MNENHIRQPGVWRPEVIVAYRRILTFNVIATVVLILVFLLLLLGLDYYNKDSLSPTLMFVCLLGVLGAFFSSLMRLYRIENLPAILLDLNIASMPRLYLILHASIPALVGMIGATVLYLILLSGLVSGDIFPKFESTISGTNGHHTFQDLLTLGPKDLVDYGKVCVWSFLAGFSERLVPDILERLAEQRE